MFRTGISFAHAGSTRWMKLKPTWQIARIVGIAPCSQARLNYRLKMIQYIETGMAGIAGSVPGTSAGARNAFAGISGAMASQCRKRHRGECASPGG